MQNIYGLATNSLPTVVILDAEHKVTAWVTNCFHCDARVLVHWCLGKQLPCRLEQKKYVHYLFGKMVQWQFGSQRNTKKLYFPITKQNLNLEAFLFKIGLEMKCFSVWDRIEIQIISKTI